MKINLLLVISFLSIHVSAHPLFLSDTVCSEKTWTEYLLGHTKKSELLQISLNTRIAFHSAFSNDNEKRSAFRFDYARLEVKGDIHERIFYKWLQHLNKSSRPGELDHMSSSIDCLGVGFRISPSLTVFAGKQYADYGGFEYDADPAEVYTYSELGEYITCFLVGVNLSWWCTPEHEIRFQVVNNGSGNATEIYGETADNIETARTPLGYTFNWNGHFFHDRLLSRCSFSIFHEGKKQNVYFTALALAWIEKKFNMYIDAMYSAEEIDKLGILSELLPADENNLRVCHSGYLSLVSRLNYRIFPKINLFIKGAYETASAQKNSPRLAKGLYRTSYSYQGGMEYFPMKNNLRFFVLYKGKQIHYTKRARSWNPDNESPQAISLGLIYNIPIF